MRGELFETGEQISIKDNAESGRKMHLAIGEIQINGHRFNGSPNIRGYGAALLGAPRVCGIASARKLLHFERRDALLP